MGLLNYLKGKVKRAPQPKRGAPFTPTKLNHSQESVYRAVRKMKKPANGMTIAQAMHLDSASVTPRLSELVRKKRIRVAYVIKGLDSKYRNYYEVNTNKMD